MLVSLDALNLEPLGWADGRVLYLIANSTDTSIFSVSRGKNSFVGILMSQVITSAALSPTGRYIAFSAPTNCGYCTLDIYDLSRQWLWIGPSGMTNYDRFVWATDGHSLVAQVGVGLISLDARLHSINQFHATGDLARLFAPSLRARLGRDSLVLEDARTGLSLVARPGGVVG
jgi:hypothetical protein